MKLTTTKNQTLFFQVLKRRDDLDVDKDKKTMTNNVYIQVNALDLNMFSNFLYETDDDKKPEDISKKDAREKKNRKLMTRRQRKNTRSKSKKVAKPNKIRPAVAPDNDCRNELSIQEEIEQSLIDTCLPSPNKPAAEGNRECSYEPSIQEGKKIKFLNEACLSSSNKLVADGNDPQLSEIQNARNSIFVLGDEYAQGFSRVLRHLIHDAFLVEASVKNYLSKGSESLIRNRKFFFGGFYPLRLPKPQFAFEFCEPNLQILIKKLVKSFQQGLLPLNPEMSY
ncbi:hypothetical protein JTB14_021305 [Gonioctena quinquepunctata]|nr:hypothetical protein JTB14_021305 [Gonioctena quinquepunctata]